MYLKSGGAFDISIDNLPPLKAPNTTATTFKRIKSCKLNYNLYTFATYFYISSNSCGGGAVKAGVVRLLTPISDNSALFKRYG